MDEGNQEENQVMNDIYSRVLLSDSFSLFPFLLSLKTKEQKNRESEERDVQSLNSPVRRQSHTHHRNSKTYVGHSFTRFPDSPSGLSLTLSLFLFLYSISRK